MYDGTKSEDALRHFFSDVHALYLKVRSSVERWVVLLLLLLLLLLRRGGRRAVSSSVVLAFDNRRFVSPTASPASVKSVLQAPWPHRVARV